MVCPQSSEGGLEERIQLRRIIECIMGVFSDLNDDFGESMFFISNVVNNLPVILLFVDWL